MKYLFFDIECSNNFDGTGKICEFGYVLTDECLSVLDHGIFLVNPDSDFEQYVIWKIIKYKVEDYLKAPKYPEVYNAHIKPLLELSDTVFVGHGLKNDIKFLSDESKRYSLPLPVLNTVDASIIWQRYHNEKQSRNLKKLVNELGIGDPQSMHNSEYDARMTVEYSKLLCEKSGLSFRELADKYFPKEDRDALLNYPKAIGSKAPSKRTIKSLKASGKRSHPALRLLAQRIEAIGERSDALKGKKVSISDNYSSDHPEELLKLIGLIKAAGGEYELYAERSDIFCTFDKTDENGAKVTDKKLSFVNSAILNGKAIEQLPLSEFFSVIGITEGSLAEIPLPDAEKLLADKA